jgi:uncharacterized membrane protein YcaP (DUF421 family)
MIHGFVNAVFGGDIPQRPLGLNQVIARSVLLFLVAIFLVRAGKSRLLGRATTLDVLLGFILGSLLSRGMTGSASLSETIASSLALIASHWLLTAACCRWHRFGDLVKGHAVELVRDGKPLVENMRQSHLSEHDLLEQMRLNGNVAEVNEVKMAYKERNGEISVVK